MARRRRVTQQQRSTTAPPPIVIQPTVLDVNPLKDAYAWMGIDKDLGFRLAFEWYATHVTDLLIGDPLDAERQKKFDRARLCKNQGDGTPYDHEKFHAWTMAIKKYEEVWNKKGLPSIDSAGTPTQHVKDIQTVLEYLNGTYSSFGVSFKLTFGADRLFSDGAILLPMAEVDAMVLQPRIKTVLGEAVTVAKVASLTPEGELDGAAFMGNLEKITNAVSDWAISLGGSVGGSVGVVPPPTMSKTGKRTPKTPGVPKAPKVPGSNPPSVDPFGVFRPNTCKAALAAKLHGGHWVLVSDLHAICTQYGATFGPISHVLKGLAKAGKTIQHRNGRKEVMVF